MSYTTPVNPGDFQWVTDAVNVSVAKQRVRIQEHTEVMDSNNDIVRSNDGRSITVFTDESQGTPLNTLGMPVYKADGSAYSNAELLAAISSGTVNLELVVQIAASIGRFLQENDDQGNIVDGYLQAPNN